jgi:hypothetical protein
MNERARHLKDIARYINGKHPAEIAPTDPTIPTDQLIDEALDDALKPEYHMISPDNEEEMAELPEEIVHKKFGAGSNKLFPGDEEIIHRYGDIEE